MAWSGTICTSPTRTRSCAFPIAADATRSPGPAAKVVDLPAGPINHHWTKNLIASPDGTSLYVTVGSNSNVGEHGIEEETDRAAILEVDLATGGTGAFRLGPAQPERARVGAQTGDAVDGGQRARRDRQRPGARLPDVGAGRRLLRLAVQLLRPAVDARVNRRGRTSSRSARAGLRARRAHRVTGARVYEGKLLPPRYAGGAFIGQHGSWNRQPLSGYKVVFVPFDGRQTDGSPRTC